VRETRIFREFCIGILVEQTGSREWGKGPLGFVELRSNLSKDLEAREIMSYLGQCLCMAGM
jgi:hypothetical protein